MQRYMTPNTADRLLRFMGEAPTGPAFRSEIEAFLEVAGIRPARFAIDVAGDPGFVDVIRSRRTTRLGRVDLVCAHILRVCDQRAEGRPDCASWPHKLSDDESRFAIGV